MIALPLFGCVAAIVAGVSGVVWLVGSLVVIRRNR